MPAAALEVVRLLAREYPADPGIVVSLLVHHVTLRRGEALYLPAGIIHAYLRGSGMELMAASDNVLRGGLTSKHIDVPELLDVLDFDPLPVPFLAPNEPSPGVREFRPHVADFRLLQVTLEGAPVEVAVQGPAILVATAGPAQIVGERSSTVLRRGEACYVTPEEGRLRLTGDGELFVATTGSSPGGASSHALRSTVRGRPCAHSTARAPRHAPELLARAIEPVVGLA